jgi:hypothetical protein
LSQVRYNEQEYRFDVTPEGALLVTHTDSKDDQNELFQNKSDELRQTAVARKLDVEGLNGEIKSLMTQIEEAEGEGVESMSIDLGGLLAIKGHHQSEIKKLESEEGVEIDFTTTVTIKSVEISPHTLVQVSFFPFPVVFPVPIQPCQATVHVNTTVARAKLSEWTVVQGRRAAANAGIIISAVIIRVSLCAGRCNLPSCYSIFPT